MRMPMKSETDDVSLDRAEQAYHNRYKEAGDFEDDILSDYFIEAKYSTEDYQPIAITKRVLEKYFFGDREIPLNIWEAACKSMKRKAALVGIMHFLIQVKKEDITNLKQEVLLRESYMVKNHPTVFVPITFTHKEVEKLDGVISDGSKKAAFTHTVSLLASYVKGIEEDLKFMEEQESFEETTELSHTLQTS